MAEEGGETEKERRPQGMARQLSKKKNVAEPGGELGKKTSKFYENI